MSTDFLPQSHLAAIPMRLNNAAWPCFRAQPRQHLAHQKLAAQNDTRLQDKRTLLLPRRVIAALRAGVAPEIGHTAHTSIHFHPLHPLSASDCRNYCSIKAKARQGKFQKSRLPLSSGLGEYVTRCPVMLSPTRDSIRGRLGATSYFISF